MLKMKLYQQLYDSKLVAVIRGQDNEDAINIAHAAYKGGILFQEITLTTPNAIEAIKQLRIDFNNHPNVFVGAGTVLDVASARLCILAGAQFIVCPHFDQEIITLCHLYQIPVMAGAMSVNEVVDALKAGVDIIKLFPGGVFGPSIIKDLKGPLPQGHYMPTGGVNLENIDTWIDHGAYAVGIGSDLTRDIKIKGYESVSQKAKAYVNKIKKP